MIKDYKIVTLCGSTRFKEQFIEAQKKLTLDGCIVISVGLFGHSGDEEVWKPGTKEMLVLALLHIIPNFTVLFMALMLFIQFLFHFSRFFLIFAPDLPMVII